MLRIGNKGYFYITGGQRLKIHIATHKKTKKYIDILIYFSTHEFHFTYPGECKKRHPFKLWYKNTVNNVLRPILTNTIKDQQSLVYFNRIISSAEKPLLRN